MVCVSLLTSVGTDAQQGEPEFFFDADPAKRLVTATFHAERGGEPASYVLYADGRFEHRWRNTVVETRCSYDETIQLLIQMARSGLLEVDPAALDRKLIERGAAPLKNMQKDGAMLVLEISLQRYRYRGVDAAPFHKRMKLWPLGVARQVFPDMPELVGLDTLVQDLIALANRAEAERRQ